VSNIVNFLFQISFVIELESLKHITQWNVFYISNVWISPVQIWQGLKIKR
jgi:hypothetical protein